MQVITTIGPDNATKTVLPFIAAKGAIGDGDSVDLFLMQEATYLASENHVNLGELHAPGLPPVSDVLYGLFDSGSVESAIVCSPCARVRGLDPHDLRPGFEFGGADVLAQQAEANDTTVTF